MNTSELAKRIGVSTKTVRRWIKDLDIPCTKNEFGHYVFEEEDLELYTKIQDELKNGTPVMEIDIKKIQPRKATLMKVQKTIPSDEPTIASLLERIKQNERKIEEKASDVVSYQLLQHRKEIEELQQKVTSLESYIQRMENKVIEEKREISLVLDNQKKPRKRRRIMGFMF